MAMPIDITALATWEPFAGIGAGELLSHDGSFSFLIKSASVKQTGDDNKETILMVLVCQDEDNKGRQVNHNCVVGGVDKKGNPMVRNLGELFHALGKTKEEIRAAAASGTLDIEKLAPSIVGKVVHGRVTAQEFNNKGKIQRNSSVDGFITRQAYEDAVKTGAHRKPHNFAASSSATVAPAGTAAFTPAAAPPASNGVLPQANIPAISF